MLVVASHRQTSGGGAAPGPERRGAAGKVSGGRGVCRRGAFAAWVIAAAMALPGGAAHPPAAYGRGGGAATAAPAATAAAVEALRDGGNAVDAAVTAALVLAVVHPQAGNLGGGGFAVVRMRGEVAALDFREVAPAGASRLMFLGRDGRPDPERSRIGPLAAGVPGSPAGLYELHRRYGRLPWARVVRPAIRLAREGFPVSPRLARDLRRHRRMLARFPETATVWLPGGRPLEAGSVLRLPQLAATLEVYARRGPEAVVAGPVAAAVEVASRAHGGVLRGSDLAAYRPVWRRPVVFEAWGWRVASMPLPSSGGIILAETVGLLRRLGWADLPRFGADRVHLLVESWRRAYADRYVLGDPATSQAGPAELLDPRWLDRRARTVRRDRATPSEKVRPFPAGALREHAATTHVSVVDGFGNAVALTTTLNGPFGCGLWVPGAGFFLNNEMDDFAAAPGVPNMYGLVQGEANAIAPGKRMLSSMSPTVAWAGGELLALGSPGGSRIPTATLQVLLNLVVDADPLQAAVDRPRIHHQWRPDRIEVEPDAVAPETETRLRKMGHAFRVVPALGEVHAVLRHPGGTVEAAADPRGPGAAAVVVPMPPPVEGR